MGKDKGGLLVRIKRDKLDILFASYIKARDKYCQRCGRMNSLQTAHFIGRRNRAVRHDGENSCLLCFSCHQHFHENPLEFVEWFKARLGDRNYDMLQARASRPQKIDRELIRLYLEQEIKNYEM